MVPPTRAWHGWSTLRAVHISARTDYAVRALLSLAAAGQDTVTGQALAAEQHLPQKFLEAILADLRRAGLVRSRRGPVGGYALARPASEIPVGEIVRAVDGPLAVVRGERPEQAVYDGAAEHLGALWVALRAAVRSVLDDVTLAQVLSGDLPKQVQDLLSSPGAWRSR
jgi:Rrf2 family protein